MKGEQSLISRRKGKKPASAYASEDAARLNIQRKAQLLEEVIDCAHKSADDAVRVALFLRNAPRSHFPRSLRQFHLWIDTDPLKAVIKHPIPEIRRIGNGTLSRNAELRVRVEQALSAVRTLENNQDEASGVDRPAKLTRELKAAKSQIDVLERELLSMRQKIRLVEKDRDDTKRLYENLKRKYREELEDALAGKTYRGGATVTRIRGGEDGH
ncbi:hypothetical protein CI15_07605 [Paraburkholderia monticola]|uniref:Uncharacterized protein n=1 Tax=Paraburkholderia monticola TaxID=1399968 RepID=A0A149PYG9_9BURK|nr:hypothetical protein [Paraburkholderia monticola]KXU90027.1 hypothetical protein CI15_07605 [Paraburkholderia monticola]